MCVCTGSSQKLNGPKRKKRYQSINCTEKFCPRKSIPPFRSARDLGLENENIAVPSAPWDEDCDYVNLISLIYRTLLFIK